jgi:hypothetical protein
MGSGDLSRTAGGEVSDPISVRARFERFPATVKGALIFRGEDQDPHQVVLHRARAVPVGPGGSSDVPLAPATLDVVPHRDVFVPFELPVSDLDPGWYALVCDVDVDGSAAAYDGGRRFSVPWPRATVRRGTVRVDRDVRVGEGTVHLEQLDCGGDSVRLQFRADPPGPLTIRLAADGRRLDLLETELDEASGRGRATAYPVMRTERVVTIDLKGRGRDAEASLDVALEG